MRCINCHAMATPCNAGYRGYAVLYLYLYLSPGLSALRSLLVQVACGAVEYPYGPSISVVVHRFALPFVSPLRLILGAICELVFHKPNTILWSWY
ncbi:hypothetical protein BDW72DRAFT_172175 [Aspergillus terricola var. indicus]